MIIKSKMDNFDGQNGEFVWSFMIILLGELSGTAFLLFFGCLGGIVVHDDYISKSTPLQVAVLWGCVVGSVVMIFGHITRAHFNPAVTLCAIILRIITPITGIIYFTAEMIGAVVGYWLLIAILPSKMTSGGNSTLGEGNVLFCNTVFSEEINPYQGFLAEFMATSFLIYAVCSAWDPRNAVWSDSVAIKFAMVITTLVLTIGPFTGASMNPARSFAPALINRVWNYHWVYWLATLAGSAVTTITYKFTYLYDIDRDIRLKEKLSDQLRQGSLYSKQEDTVRIKGRGGASSTTASVKFNKK